MYRRSIALFFISIWSTFAFSKTSENNRVYLLHDARTPTKITTKPGSYLGITMRAPDLDGQAQLGAEVGENKKIHGKKQHDEKKLEKPLLASHSAMNFHAMRIAGTMRMPRVRFASVALPISIREAKPNIDFLPKTLENEP